MPKFSKTAGKIKFIPTLGIKLGILNLTGNLSPKNPDTIESPRTIPIQHSFNTIICWMVKLSTFPETSDIFDILPSLKIFTS